MKILRSFNSNNPAGIVFNPGYIALAAALLTDMSGEEALHEFCGLPCGGAARKQAGRGKRPLILQAMKEHPELSYSAIGRLVGCTREMVRYVANRKKPKRKKAGNE